MSKTDILGNAFYTDIDCTREVSSQECAALNMYSCESNSAPA